MCATEALCVDSIDIAAITAPSSTFSRPSTFLVSGDSGGQYALRSGNILHKRCGSRCYCHSRSTCTTVCRAGSTSHRAAEATGSTGSWPVHSLSWILREWMTATEDVQREPLHGPARIRRKFGHQLINLFLGNSEIWQHISCCGIGVLLFDHQV